MAKDGIDLGSIQKIAQHTYSDPKKCYGLSNSLYNQNKEDQELSAYCLYYMAKSKRYLDQLKLAEDYILKGLRMVRDPYLKMDMLAEYSVILQLNNNYLLSYEYLYNAYEEVMDLDNNQCLLKKIYNSFGVFYAEINDQEKALENFIKSYQLCDKEKDVVPYSVVCLNIGECYIIYNQLEHALKYCQKAYEVIEQNDIKIVWSFYYSVMTQCYMAKGDYDKALDYANKGIYLSLKDENQEYIKALNYKAHILLIKGQYPCAKACYQYIWDKACQKGMDKEREQALDGLIKICKATKDKDQLILYLEEFHRFTREQENKELTNIRHSIRSLEEKLLLNKEKEQYERNIFTLKQQNEMLNQMNKSIKDMYELCKGILMKNEMDQVFKALHTNILGLADAETFTLSLVDNDKKKIQIMSICAGSSNLIKTEVDYDIKKNIVSRVIENDNNLYIQNKELYDEEYEVIQTDTEGHTQSALFIPLRDDKEVLGAISIQSTRVNAYSEDSISLMEIIASFASVAIINILKSKQLNYLSTRDPLTDLYNRRALREKVNTLKKNKVAMLFIDIDYFKEYNDYYGHLKGDECIQKLALLLSDTLDKEDFIARYGGDEFIVLLNNTSNENIKKSVERIEKRVKNLNLEHASSKICNYITLSIGAASMNVNESSTIDDILHISDKALYKAKRKGRDQAAYFLEQCTK